VPEPDYTDCAQGSWLSFGGSPAAKLVTIRGQESMSTRDLTGLASPANVREIRPGERQPLEIMAVTRGMPQFARNGVVAPLTISSGGQTITLLNAFVKSVDWESTTGSRIQTTTVFVAY
jgi:hypothetical protein